jgi:cytochrome c peroxidase
MRVVRVRALAVSCMATSFVIPTLSYLASPSSEASAQTTNSVARFTEATPLQLPENAPAWLADTYRSMQLAPVPQNLSAVSGVPIVIPQNELDVDSTGVLGTYQPAGATATGGNAFFQSLGTNGRACITCHEPSNAMSVNVSSIQQRYLLSFGTDPLFAPVDAATCPNNVQANHTHASPYYLILNKGLFRIPLPVPANAEFTISVVSDPWGCNTNPTYDQVTNPSTGVTTQIVSVYRRSLMASNLKFKVQTGANTGEYPAIDEVTGAPLPVDPTTGQLENGNLMSDGREPTLTSQAIDAVLTHAQGKVIPTAAQLAQIVAFESGIYSAQSSDFQAGSLSSAGVTGGPVFLSNAPAGQVAAVGEEVVNDYDAWQSTSARQSPSRASIYRGQQIFNNLSFIVSNDAGLNNIPGVPNGIPLTCSGCHGQIQGTTEAHPVGQHSLGIGGSSPQFGGPSPSTDLPVFKLTCNSGATTPFNGTVVVTNDPGKALITGKCADIGRFTTPQLHGLAARAPYFSDGSAATLQNVVNFYNQRFKIGLNAQNIQDLVNFLNTL